VVRQGLRFLLRQNGAGGNSHRPFCLGHQKKMEASAGMVQYESEVIEEHDL
jgi:hypothetical protein